MLEKYLPPRQIEIVPDGAEECTLMDLDPDHDSRRRDMHTEYDEDESGPSRVQCATN